MDTTAVTHYEVLGVGRGAMEAEIRSAWARKVREHPPDKDPVGNQRINEAKQTLLDPKARAHYDALLDHGAEIMELMTELAAARESKDGAAAARILQRLLALEPADYGLRNAYALALRDIAKTDAALAEMRRVVQEAPDVALYHYNLASMLQEGPSAESTTALDESLRHMQQAVALEPNNADYHVGLSRCYVKRKQFDKAEKCIEDAVLTDGKLDVQDVDALIELAMIHTLSGHPEKVEGDADRILNAVDGLSQEIHDYCAFRFAEVAVYLLKEHIVEPAYCFAAAAAKCSPSNMVFVQLRDEADRVRNLHSEVRKLADDSTVPQAIKSALLAQAGFVLGLITETDARFQFAIAQRALQNLNSQTIVRGLDSAQRAYPTVYGLNREAYDEWRSKASKDAEQSPGVTCVTCGCAALIAVVILAILLS